MFWVRYTPGMTAYTSIARPRLAALNRRQMVFRSVDVELLIDEDHSARSIWELVGRLDLSLYYADIASVEGRAGREHTDPQLLISLWLYAYSRGISSAREIARQCEYEPGFQWLCALEPISHRTLSGFRADHKAALDDLFVQVLGMLSAEGLITMERVTLDGTKIKANAGGNTFRGKEKIEAHLHLAREQVRLMEEQSAEEEQMAKRQLSARRRAARQRTSRLEAALREVERLQREKKQDRDSFVPRASSTDPEAHVMRNGEGGTVPSYNVQLVTDTTHGLIVNVEATTDAIDYRQLEPALNRCLQTLGRRPQQIVADGDYTNHASVQAAANCGVDFYGSWQASWRPGERDAQGRSAPFQASAFVYNAEQDCFTCPAGQTLTHHAILNRGHGVRTHVYRAPKEACRTCAHRSECAPQKARPLWVRSITRIEEPAATTVFKAKMATEEARRIYRQRSRIAEFPHAWIKQRCGLRQFRCRGRLKATMEATWASLSYNIMRWFALRRRQTLAEAARILT
jgi:transposase